MSDPSPRKLTLADHYPVGMSICAQTGMGGGCGPECEAFLDGDCSIEEEIREATAWMDGDQYLLFSNEEQ